MDTEISVAGNLKDRHERQESIKVYTRRSRIRNLKNNLTSDTNVVADDKNDGKSKDDHEDESNDMNIDTIADQSIHTSATQDLNLVQEKDNYTVPDQTLQIVDIEDLNSEEEEGNATLLDQSLQIKPTKDIYLVQKMENTSQLNSGSEESLSDHVQPLQVAVENGYEDCNGNEPSKPIIAKVDGRVRISLTPARPKNEVRELKRKLEDELDQVRSLVQRLEAKKIQLTTYSVGTEGYGGSHSHLQRQAKDVIAQARVNSVVGSAGRYDSRPFQHLSVQVFGNIHDGIEFGEKEKRTPKENQYYRSSEFLLAKDRLPPAENNKKLKTNCYGVVRNRYTIQALKRCNNLLTSLMRHKFAWVFNKPVDAKALGLHDYHYIIRNPMDLGTVKSKLAKNRYKSPGQFAEDVRLTFRNAMTYNPRGHDVYVMAEELMNMFEDKWIDIESEFTHSWRYGLVQEMSLYTPPSRKVPLSPPSLSRPPAFDMPVLERAELMTVPMDSYVKPKTPVVRTLVPKKPKAKDPDKRDMTGDEKQRLTTQLQNLPSDKMDAILEIVKRGKGSLSQLDDEIELDIDRVDKETLWELDRLVTNYKKNLSKRKRRAELAQARAESRQDVSAMNHAPDTIPAPEASMKDQSNVTTLSLPGERKAESSSSSSSSSDSDSDSDSSDSDSDSSSGYRSDAGPSPKT